MKKLSLTKETLVALTTQDAKEVNGGGGQLSGPVTLCYCPYTEQKTCRHQM